MTQQSECTRRGCCWSPLSDGSKKPWCFFKNSDDCGHVESKEKPEPSPYEKAKIEEKPEPSPYEKAKIEEKPEPSPYEKAKIEEKPEPSPYETTATVGPIE